MTQEILAAKNSKHRKSVHVHATLLSVKTDLLTVVGRFES
jgi:hypothetical protein